MLCALQCVWDITVCTRSMLLVKGNHLSFSSFHFCFKVTVSFYYSVINCITWFLLVNTEFTFISLYWCNIYEDWEEGHWTCCNSSFHWPKHQNLCDCSWDQLLLYIYLERFSKRYVSILSHTISYSGQGKTTRVKLLRHLAFVFSSSHHCGHSCTNVFLWVPLCGVYRKPYTREGVQGLFKHKPGNSAGSFWSASFKKGEGRSN